MVRNIVRYLSKKNEENKSIIASETIEPNANETIEPNANNIIEQIASKQKEISIDQTKFNPHLKYYLKKKPIP